LINFCSKSEDGKLQNSTTGCCYFSQTEAKLSTKIMQHANCLVKTNKVQTFELTRKKTNLDYIFYVK